MMPRTDSLRGALYEDTILECAHDRFVVANTSNEHWLTFFARNGGSDRNNDRSADVGIR
jgi:hypothetical protein